MSAIKSIAVGSSTLELVIGDITQQHVDAIVNAANSQLAGGGGVDGAIHRAGGPSIMQETAGQFPGGCPTGEAVLTGAGRLPAKYVIHAVGPRWRDGKHGEARQLASAYRRSLELAVAHECRAIAFPALSAGAYGYPLQEAAAIALQECISFLQQANGQLLVRFVLFNEQIFDTFSAELNKLQQDIRRKEVK